jgi:hypothetical protein
MQVVAVAYEPGIGTYADDHERVASISALESGMSFAAQADSLAVVDPRGHVDRELASHDNSTLAHTVRAR